MFRVLQPQHSCFSEGQATNSKRYVVGSISTQYKGDRDLHVSGSTDRGGRLRRYHRRANRGLLLGVERRLCVPRTRLDVKIFSRWPYWGRRATAAEGDPGRTAQVSSLRSSSSR
jgi:hypothetical protein